MAEAGDAVNVAQIDLNFVREARLDFEPLGVPEGVWVPIKGVGRWIGGATTVLALVAQLLAIDVVKGPGGLRD